MAQKKKETPIRGQKPRETNKPLAPATVNRYMTYMRVVFSYCVNDLDIIDLNPMAKVKKLSEKNERKRFLEAKEIVKLLEKCQKVDENQHTDSGWDSHIVYGFYDFRKKPLHKSLFRRCGKECN